MYREGGSPGPGLTTTVHSVHTHYCDFVGCRLPFGLYRAPSKDSVHLCNSFFRVMDSNYTQTPDAGAQISYTGIRF